MLRQTGLAFAILLVYLTLLTCSHYWDGVLFSFYIENVAAGLMPRSVLFHPNHLFYSAVGFVLYDMFSAAHLRAITCLQIADAVCGTAAAVLLHSMVRNLTSNRTVALFCAVLFAFGATWWKFSTDAASYVPAVFLLMLAVRAALAGRSLEASSYHLAALLLHQLAVFAYVPVVFALAMKAGRRSAAIYTAVDGAVSIALYAAVFQLSGAALSRSFVPWMLSFSGEAKTTSSLGQVLKTYPVSYLKLFLGGKLSLVRDFASAPVVTALVAAVVLLLAGFWLLRRPMSERYDAKPDKTVAKTLWLWIAPYAVFLAWWEPGNAFYKLFLWPPVVLWLGIAINNHPWWRQRTRALLAFSVSMMAWNLGAFIYPHTKPAADPIYSLALRMDKEMPAKAKVYYRNFSPDDWYLAYFTPGRSWQSAPMGKLAAETPLCLETTALSAPDVDRSGLREVRSWQVIDDKHHVRVACFQ